MGLVGVPQSTKSQDGAVSTKNGQLLQQLTQSHSDNQVLQQKVADKGQKITQLQQKLIRANEHLTRTNDKHEEMIVALLPPAPL